MHCNHCSQCSLFIRMSEEYILHSGIGSDSKSLRSHCCAHHSCGATDPRHPLCVWLVYDSHMTPLLRAKWYSRVIYAQKLYFTLFWTSIPFLKIRIVFPVILFLIKFAQKMRFFLSIEKPLVWHRLACLRRSHSDSSDSHSNEWINAFDWYSYIIRTAGALNSGASDLNNSRHYSTSKYLIIFLFFFCANTEMTNDIYLKDMPCLRYPYKCWKSRSTVP